MIAEMSRIDRSIEINAPPDRVWRALTNADELSDWFKWRSRETSLPDVKSG